jgi:broad specificity phosphatase PhoE
MKPDRIFLVRHGESEGNANKAIYKDTPDYTVLLTDKGHKQAIEVGKKIANVIGPSQTVQFYVSPFWRTRQTFIHIAEEFPSENVRYYEDLRLREQEWGQDMVSRKGVDWDGAKARDAYGHTYYRFDDGESCADEYDRKSDIIGTMYRDFEKEDFPRNVVVVFHGMAMRVFIMRWFKASVEEFETWANPKNCEYLLLERGNTGKYKLVTPMRLHKVRHNYQFDWAKWTKKYQYLGEPKVPYVMD